MEARKRLRELVDAKEILVLPGAYDALSARLAEAAGFPCVYMTGYGQSASKLGAPDVVILPGTKNTIDDPVSYTHLTLPTTSRV